MVFCIGCGKFNRKYFFILFAILSKLISQMALGLRYSVFHKLEIFVINLEPITNFTSSFLFSSIFGIIFLFINIKCLEKKESSLTSKKISSKKEIYYIVNDYNPSNSCKIIKILLLLGIIFAFTELFDQLFYSNNLGGLDYWMFEIIFINIFMSKYLKIKILLHQKYSLYFCVVSSFIFKFISNFLYSHSLNEKPKADKFEYVYNKYNHWIFIPIFILLLILMMVIRAYGNTKLKYSMDILFLSPYRLLMTYGLIGLIICIIYIVLSLFIDFKPLGNIYDNLKKFDISVLISTIIYGTFNSLKILFDILIIKNLSPFHLLVKFKIYYLLIQLILFCHNQQIASPNFYFVELSSDIVCFLGYLVFLELIEIRCKGLNYELRISIIERAENEVIESLYDERECKYKII